MVDVGIVNRRAIMEALTKGQMTTTDLVIRTGQSHSILSKHLARLEAKGHIVYERGLGGRPGLVRLA